jgi:hypothetical protein
MLDYSPECPEIEVGQNLKGFDAVSSWNDSEQCAVVLQRSRSTTAANYLEGLDKCLAYDNQVTLDFSRLKTKG